MWFIRGLLQNNGICHLCPFNSLFRIGVIKTYLKPSTSRWVVRQKPEQWIGVIGAVAVQLENLITVGHNGKVDGNAMRFHIEYRSKKITLLHYISND